MDKFGVNTQKWKLGTTADEVEKGATALSNFILLDSNLFLLDAAELVIKAQIHAGGRGKGVFNTGFKGGVHLCKTYRRKFF